MPFISFSCFIALDRTPRTMLNRNGENKTPFLVLDFRGKVFCSSHLNMMLALGFHTYPFLD